MKRSPAATFVRRCGAISFDAGSPLRNAPRTGWGAPSKNRTQGPRIIYQASERVAENRSSFVERNAVLRVVVCGFTRIPFEARSHSRI